MCLRVGKSIGGREESSQIITKNRWEIEQENN